MSSIETASGLETVLTDHIHYGFRWMGDHWKQEIIGVGGCQAMPKIWSTEGVITREGRLVHASPAYERVDIQQEGETLTVARLDGRSDTLTQTARFRFEELEEGFVVDVEVQVEGHGPDDLAIATYLVETSEGRLDVGVRSAAITWSHPSTRLIFEAVAPCEIEAHEAGMGTIRLKAMAPPDNSSEVRTLRYRWRWLIEAENRLWDREA